MSVHEMSKVEQRGRYWVVLILSAAIGKWIVQGEWLTKQEAEADLINWR